MREPLGQKFLGPRMEHGSNTDELEWGLVELAPPVLRTVYIREGERPRETLGGEGESPAAAWQIQSASTRRGAGCGVPSPRGRGKGEGEPDAANQNARTNSAALSAAHNEVGETRKGNSGVRPD